MPTVSAKRGPYKKGFRADYGDATPQQVARAMMRSVPRVPVEKDGPQLSLFGDLVQRLRRTFRLREKRV